ncbi:Pycsar system effector family protein [Streptomyces olivaceiscleroticus]|uniref:Pycsar effector protein domain-containing protein n=1 Tax=Streptomyces olivaceiscleroticus TaxID=68245 RepID=A0ABN0ZP26_9ACTN
MNQPRTDIDARLDAATDQVLTEISRTDSKASVLLTAFSLPLAALVAAVPGRDLPAPAAVLIGAGTVGLVAAMLVVLVVVRPRITGHAPGSYLRWAECATEDEILQDLTTAESRASQVMRLSRIARKKYKGLRVAGDITAAALIVLALALLTAL